MSKGFLEEKLHEAVVKKNRELGEREMRADRHPDNGRLLEYESGWYRLEGLPARAEVRWLAGEVVSHDFGQLKRLGSIADFLKKVELDMDKLLESTEERGV